MKTKISKSDHDNQIVYIFEYIRQLESDNEIKKDFAKRKRIGFK
jgi:hypothetical protein